MNNCGHLYTYFLDRAVQWSHKTAQDKYPDLFLKSHTSCFIWASALLSGKEKLVRNFCYFVVISVTAAWEAQAHSDTEGWSQQLQNAANIPKAALRWSNEVCVYSCLSTPANPKPVHHHIPCPPKSWETSQVSLLQPLIPAANAFTPPEYKIPLQILCLLQQLLTSPHP